ncbi:MAG TPA: DUF1572 domain-containing protein [Phnomibacter sp.]|nr:DUF1572 domain-containing protein [Phnomibacter sp.]
MLTLPHQIATHLRQAYTGGNWTCVSWKDALQDITLPLALQSINNSNSIATLFCHSHYYIQRQLKVLQGLPLEGHDVDSFALPPLPNEAAWQTLIANYFAEAETMAQAIEKLSAEAFEQTFVQEKYGNYYRNLAGAIEHLYYHMGQAVWLRKWLLQRI